MIETLLNDLANSGWTISWAFQFAPDHWRVSIIQYTDVGETSGHYISFCADAPTFAEALEDAILRRNDNSLWEPTPETTWTPDTTPRNLLEALGLRPAPVKIERRL
jgi:hypothetical protein